MANRSDSTIQFFKKASSEQWTYLLSCYKEAVGAKALLRTKKGGPEQYLKLDTWYQEALPKTIRSRKDPHLEYHELVDIMKWKLMRSKYKPAALDLVKTNTEKNVKATTQRAFKRMPKLDVAIQALTVGLKGIGTATASAILAAAFPDYAPYMAEECMVSTPDVEAEDYTQAEYLKYADHYQKFAKKLEEKDAKGDWNPHKVELAIWSHYVLRLHKPELLDKMPGQVESNGCGDEESNQGLPGSEGQTLAEGQRNGVSSSCDDDDSQQSNGTLNHDDSNSLPPHVTANGNGNGTPAATTPANKNGHPECNTTDNDTRSSLVEQDQDACCEESQDSQQPSQSSQPASDLEMSQDSSSVQTTAVQPPTGADPAVPVEAVAPAAAAEAPPAPAEGADGDAVKAATTTTTTTDKAASGATSTAVKRSADENGLGQDSHDQDSAASVSKKQKLDDESSSAAATTTTTTTAEAESATTTTTTTAPAESATTAPATTDSTTSTTTVPPPPPASDSATTATPVVESQ